MKKKIVVLLTLLFMSTSIFAFGFTNVPSSGKEIIVMKGNVVVWHAAYWKLEIDAYKYTDLKLYNGGEDFIKVYTFTGTPIGEDSKTVSKLNSWETFRVVDCEDLTWFFK